MEASRRKRNSIASVVCFQFGIRWIPKVPNVIRGRQKGLSMEAQWQRDVSKWVEKEKKNMKVMRKDTQAIRYICCGNRIRRYICKLQFHRYGFDLVSCSWGHINTVFIGVIFFCVTFMSHVEEKYFLTLRIKVDHIYICLNEWMNEWYVYVYKKSIWHVMHSEVDPILKGIYFRGNQNIYRCRSIMDCRLQM